MGRTVAELEVTMSYRELQDWADYYALEPWGERRADLRNGILCSLTANMNRDKKKKPEPFKATDFMPFESDESPPPEPPAARVEAAQPKRGARISGELLTQLFVRAAVDEKKREGKK